MRKQKNVTKPIVWFLNQTLSATLYVMISLVLAACTGATALSNSNPSSLLATQTAPLTAQPTTPTNEAKSTICALTPVVVPTLPANIPGYTDLDPSTGLHVTGQYQEIDVKSYRLEVSGKVDHPLSLSYDDLRCMPKVETTTDLICPGYFKDEATWAGVPLTYILDLASVQQDAAGIEMFSADGYSAYLTLDVARSGKNFLAYEWDGQPLPILHGFPLRAAFPGLEGNRWVKWLVKIAVY
jgi:DMSO/TMAO reductase YedYZ molybdopterin-dependent catalytic subunit